MLNEKRVMDLLVSPKLKNLFWVIFCHLSRKEEIKDRPISRQRQEFYHRESFNFVVGLAVMREDLLHSLQGLRYYYPSTSRLRQKQKCWGKFKYFRPRRLATDLDVRNETIHKCTTKKPPWWNRRIQLKNCEDLNTTLCLLRPIDWLSLFYFDLFVMHWLDNSPVLTRSSISIFPLAPTFFNGLSRNAADQTIRVAGRANVKLSMSRSTEQNRLRGERVEVLWRNTTANLTNCHAPEADLNCIILQESLKAIQILSVGVLSIMSLFWVF